MPFGQSAIVGVIAAELIDGLVLRDESNKERSEGKALTCAFVGGYCSLITLDAVGAVGTAVMSLGYLGYYHATGEVLGRDMTNPARSSP